MAGTDTCDQVGGRAGGTRVVPDPVSGAALAQALPAQSCPARATQKCPGCPQPLSRQGAEVAPAGRCLQQRLVTENC